MLSSPWLSDRASLFPYEADVKLCDLTGCLRCCSRAGYNISLSILEGMSNSPDIWNAVNGLNQQGYEGALGAAPTHQTQPGSYSNLQPPSHNHLVRFTSTSSDIDNTALLNPLRIKRVFVYGSGLLPTFSDGCRYQQGSPTNVHFPPQQYGTAHSVTQHLREFNRWGNGRKNNLHCFVLNRGLFTL